MPPDFMALRKQFPALTHWAHFDIARKAPLPRSVETAMNEYMRDVYERAGERAFSMEEVERARETVARALGAPPKTLAFIKNTSEGLNIAASGLGLKPGDKVILTELEHSACVLPFRRLAARGAEVEVVRPRAGRLPVEAFVEKMDERTRALAVSWVTYATGIRVDVEALSRICRQRDICLVVDAIQAMGVLSTPLSELGADMVVAGGHKALLSHIGAGILYCREEWIPRITPPCVARFSFASDDKWAEPLVLASDAHRFEYGNPNFLGIWCLRSSAELIHGIGLPHIEARVRHLTETLLELADEKGLPVVTPRPWEHRAGIVSFELPEPERIRAELYAQKIIVNVKDERYLRTSTHFYNTEEEIERLIESVARSRR